MQSYRRLQLHPAYISAAVGGKLSSAWADEAEFQGEKVWMTCRVGAGSTHDGCDGVLRTTGSRSSAAYHDSPASPAGRMQHTVHGIHSVHSSDGR